MIYLRLTMLYIVPALGLAFAIVLALRRWRPPPPPMTPVCFPEPAGDSGLHPTIP